MPSPAPAIASETAPAAAETAAAAATAAAAVRWDEEAAQLQRRRLV